MKSVENLSCWIVTEGLAGTENQCLGVAEALGVTAEVKRVGLRWPWSALSPYLGLEQDWSFTEPLDAPYPDLLIVSGRKAVAVARYVKKRSFATVTVFLQDPRCNPADFDLVIAPAHDGVRGENVVKSVAAPNRITDDKLTAAAKHFPALSALPSPRVAVLIGGDSKAHRLTPPIMTQLVKQLKGLQASLMITTSRRTGADNEDLLRKAFQDSDAYIWDGQGDNPYFAMLALADTIIVTNDSTSMLSEAATTGKPVYMVPLAGGGRRIDAMQANLVTHGAVRVFDGTLESWTYSPLRDAQLAADAITSYINKHE